jgi:pyruvate dehydrogenase E1 component beta subunit
MQAHTERSAGGVQQAADGAQQAAGSANPNGRELTFREAVREALWQEMERDECVFIIGEDVGVYGGAFGVTLGMVDHFGEERVIDTPISELGIAGAITGAALTGMRPVGEIMFMDFTTLAMEQLVNQAAKMRFMFGGAIKVPFVLRTPAGSGTGAAAQHSQSLENWFVHVPGLKVVMPSTPYDVKGLLLASIRDDNPVIFIEHKLLYKTKGPVPEQPYTVPLGQAHVRRKGRDVTIVATGIMVSRSLAAAVQLSEEGIEAEVLDPCTLKPLDAETIVRSVSKTGRALVVHEACKTGGYGGELAAVIAESEAFDYLDAPILRLAGRDMPIPYNRTLEYHTVPQVEDILSAARRLAQGRV